MSLWQPSNNALLLLAAMLVAAALAWKKWGHLFWYLRAFLLLKHHSRSFVKARRTVADTFQWRVSRTPHALALRFEGRSYTFLDLDRLSNRVAHWAIESARIVPRQVVALLMSNRPEYVITWLGLAKAGASIALLNTEMKAKGLVHSLNVSGATHFIVGTEFVRRVAEVAGDLDGGMSYWFLGEKGVEGGDAEFRVDDVSGGGGGAGGAGAIAAAGAAAAAAASSAGDLDSLASKISNIPPEDWGNLEVALAQQVDTAVSPAVRRGMTSHDLLFYIYTSGTTGLPKAAKIKHSRFYLSGVSFALFHGLRSDDRIYCPLPVYHSAAGMVGICMSWFTGCALVLRRKFSASQFFRDCVDQECTVIQYIGQLCRYLLNTPESVWDRRHRIRMAIGNGMRIEVWSKFMKRFNIPYVGEFYGSTEGNATLINNQNKVGAVGYIPYPARFFYPIKLVKFDHHAEAPVRDSKGRCIECSAGEPGELIGKIVANDPLREFEGYTNAKASKSKILRNAFSDGDAWFRTGDLLKKDRDGFVFFVDRIGDTFRWKGQNVSTNEVAQVLTDFHQFSDVNVYGVEVPFQDGRAGMAAVVAPGGVRNMDWNELYRLLEEQLPSYAKPLFIRVQERLVVTTTFKHRKVDLKQEGWDPSRVNEPVFFRDDRRATFVQIDDVLYEDICAGKVRI